MQVGEWFRHGRRTSQLALDANISMKHVRFFESVKAAASPVRVRTKALRG